MLRRYIFFGILGNFVIKICEKEIKILHDLKIIIKRSMNCFLMKQMVCAYII